jgi:hypothetical protein
MLHAAVVVGTHLLLMCATHSSNSYLMIGYRRIHRHIPKTGGSSIETNCTNQSCIISRMERQQLYYTHPVRSVSAWHIPPDKYEEIMKEPFDVEDKPRYCVVRNPKDRFYSCERWQAAYGDKYDFPWHRSAEQLRRLRLDFERKQFSTLTEELLHRIPQHRFVWSPDCVVQCDCVVAFEKMNVLTTNKVNPGKHKELNITTPYFLESMYKGDALLWKAAKDAEFCLRPTRALCHAVHALTYAV